MSPRMKIMAIDDNTVNLATIEQELKDKYDIVPMLTGRRAIKYLYRENVDLILLDVQMPVMDGIETLREIRTLENGVTIPVVFLTARKDAATVVAGSQLGIMDYITKPFDPADLKSRIEQVFKRLGVLPMEQQELLDTIAEISRCIHDHNIKVAIAKIDEMLHFQVDDDVAGRMRMAKRKLELGEVDQAKNAVDRVLALLDRGSDDTIGSTLLPPISLSEISTKLLYAKDDIINFRLEDSLEKLKYLNEYDVPQIVRYNIKQCISRIKEYDEEPALDLIEEMLKFISNEQGKAAMRRKTDNTGGYRAKYFGLK